MSALRALFALAWLQLARGWTVAGPTMHSRRRHLVVVAIAAPKTLAELENFTFACTFGITSEYTPRSEGLAPTFRPYHLFRQQTARLMKTLDESTDASEIAWAIEELCQLPDVLPGQHEHAVYTAMMRACKQLSGPAASNEHPSRDGCDGPSTVLRLLNAMQLHGLEPNDISYAAALDSCAAFADERTAQHIYSMAGAENFAFGDWKKRLSKSQG
jgi:hypothetical protein